MVQGAEVIYKSGTDEWETPQDVFDRLNEEFDFDLDPCATGQNHKCSTYYTKDQDGLSKTWGGSRVFCNPPYSEIKKWVRKAYEESFKPGTIVVLLIPARTDTKYFHDYILHRSEIRFIKGRLRYSNSRHNCPFPSMVVIFRAAGM